jgi:serine protease inhibitor
MPQQQDSLSGLLAHISQGSLEQDLKTADTLNYHLYLPRFSINQHSPMKAALAQMGIEDAFSFRADFSGMLGDSLRLPLAQVVHHAGIELNESGVRSAVPRAAAALDRSNSPVVRINRSFVFFIREKHTGLILYSGVYHGIEADN